MDFRIFTKINSKPELKQLFRNVPKTILNYLTYEELPPNKNIIEKGSPVKKVFIICSGRLRVSNEFPNGKLYEFGFVENIGFSGLLEFFAGEDFASSTVRTVSKTVLISIPRKQFSFWIEKDNAALRLIVGFFAKQIYPTTNSIGFVFSNPGLFSLIQYIAQRVSRQGQGMLPETREETANKLGLSLRTVYRLTAKLKEHGFIDVEKRKITVNDKQYQKMKTYLEEFE